MIKTSTKRHSKNICIIAILCMSFFCVSIGFAQKKDSVHIMLRGKSTTIKRTPQLKTNTPIYRIPFITTFNTVTPLSKLTIEKPDRNLTVSKIYPNPVNDQVNIIIHLEKESNLSIKILDILSNEVLTLSNEKAPSGEQTKNFTLPKKLNPGIYFIRLIAGQESISKRISVL